MACAQPSDNSIPRPTAPSIKPRTDSPRRPERHSALLTPQPVAQPGRVRGTGTFNRGARYGTGRSSLPISHPSPPGGHESNIVRLRVLPAQLGLQIVECIGVCDVEVGQQIGDHDQHVRDFEIVSRRRSAHDALKPEIVNVLHARRRLKAQHQTVDPDLAESRYAKRHSAPRRAASGFARHATSMSILLVT